MWLDYFNVRPYMRPTYIYVQIHAYQGLIKHSQAVLVKPAAAQTLSSFKLGHRIIPLLTQSMLVSLTKCCMHSLSPAATLIKQRLNRHSCFLKQEKSDENTATLNVLHNIFWQQKSIITTSVTDLTAITVAVSLLLLQVKDPTAYHRLTRPH